MGNYEFYYGAGLFSRLSGISLPEQGSPEELKEAVKQALTGYEPKNEEEAHLIKCLREARVEDQKNAEMEELFQVGQTEDRLWQV